MSVWRRLVESEKALEVYRNSPLFHLIVDKVRAYEEVVSGDPIAFLGEILANVCNVREEWVQAGIKKFQESVEKNFV